MKYLPPSNGGTLKKSHLQVLAHAKQVLEACGDLDVWCERLGFELVRTDLVTHPARSFVLADIIFIPKGLTRQQEAWAIAHEYAHHKFHAPTTAFRTLDVYTINKHEREANLFADELCQL